MSGGIKKLFEEKVNINQDLNEKEEELIDPYCLDKNPLKITFHDVTSAAFLIKGGVENTPCFVSSFIGLCSF